MPAKQVADQIRAALDDIKKADLDDPRLGEVLSLAESLTDAMKMFFTSLDNSVFGEFKYISEYIARTRDEIAALQPNDIREERLPSAGAELDAVVSDTEHATDTIMHEIETVMEWDGTDPNYKNDVDAALMRIIEACSFQDITGQRVRKVVTTLTHIEERMARFSDVMGVADAVSKETDKETWQRENYLNGPAIGGPEVEQDTIDDLFDGAIDIDQDDIDSLFD